MHQASLLGHGDSYPGMMILDTRSKDFICICGNAGIQSKDQQNVTVIS